ncbi:hypothetical protein D3C85_1194220 [compost metagenome]
MGTFAACILYGREYLLTYAEVAEDRHDIAGPADRHGRGGDAVFKHQQPAHDPGEDLAEGAVGIGIGRAGHRHGRGQFRVAETGETAGDARDHEGQHDGRTGVGRGHLTRQHEDAGADDGADAQAHQIDWTQRPFQLALGGFLLDLGNGLSKEKSVAGWLYAVCGHVVAPPSMYTAGPPRAAFLGADANHPKGRAQRGFGWTKHRRRFREPGRCG